MENKPDWEKKPCNLRRKVIKFLVYKASERPHHAGCFEKNLACFKVADKDFGLGMLGRSYWLLWLS
jgi:hypothetical protein